MKKYLAGAAIAGMCVGLGALLNDWLRLRAENAVLTDELMDGDCPCCGGCCCDFEDCDAAGVSCDGCPCGDACDAADIVDDDDDDDDDIGEDGSDDLFSDPAE